MAGIGVELMRTPPVATPSPSHFAPKLQPLPPITPAGDRAAPPFMPNQPQFRPPSSSLRSSSFVPASPGPAMHALLPDQSSHLPSLTLEDQPPPTDSGAGGPLDSRLRPGRGCSPMASSPDQLPLPIAPAPPQARPPSKCPSPELRPELLPSIFSSGQKPPPSRSPIKPHRHSPTHARQAVLSQAQTPLAPSSPISIDGADSTSFTSPLAANDRPTFDPPPSDRRHIFGPHFPWSSHPPNTFTAGRPSASSRRPRILLYCGCGALLCCGVDCDAWVSILRCGCDACCVGGVLL